MAAIDSKQCTLCKQTLPVASFYPAPKRKDGLYPWCRTCSVRKTREYNDRKPNWKERKREYDKARVQRLKDSIRAQNKARYERNRERRIADAAAWSARNRERRRLISQTYKHRRRTVEREGMTWRELRDWKAAHPKVCHWCGKSCARSFTVDHIEPLSRGGKHEARNLCIACRPCNSRKQAKDPIEFAQSIGKLL